MDENGKLALQGLSRIGLSRVTKNDTEGYAVGTKLNLPNVQSMSKTPDVTGTKIYADDGIYLDLKSWNGINVDIVFAEMTLGHISELGFGTYDASKKTLVYDPQGKNLEYALTMAVAQANGEYRMYKWFSLTVNEVVEGEHQTKGDGTDICQYTLKGTLTKRKFDNIPAEIHVGADLEWLDDIEVMPAA